MNFKKWIGILILPLLIQCENKSYLDEYHFEPLDSIAFDNGLIELGEKLFFDPRLSLNNTISCSSCHLPELAFTDGKKLSIGIHQRVGKRNTPSIWNVKNQKEMMWDGGVKSLEHQAIVPLQDTNEMGGTIMDLFPKLADVPIYDSFSKVLYNRSFDPYVLTRSLSAYQRSIYQENTEFDDWKKKGIVKDSALVRGYRLFDDVINCTKCHSESSFTDNSMQNNGLYFVYEDLGHYNISTSEQDKGKFKVPSLRNVSITAPYMHDGSFKTLHEVIMHYESGGVAHPNKSQFITPFTISAQDRNDLLYFLKSLTDKRFVN